MSTREWDRCQRFSCLGLSTRSRTQCVGRIWCTCAYHVGLGPVSPKKNWLCEKESFNKANLKLPEDRFQHIKAFFLQQIVALVIAHSIPPELFIDLDETGIKLVPVGDWSIAPEGSKRVEVAGLGDRRQITATFADTLRGAFLLIQLLYQGKTDCCHAKFPFPDGFHIYRSPNYWASEETVKLFYHCSLCSSCSPWKADSWPKGSSDYGQLQSPQNRICTTTSGRQWCACCLYQQSAPTTGSQHKQSCQRLPVGQVQAIVC